MRRIVFVLIVILSVLCQPCFAADKKTDFSQYKKPEGEIVHHDICVYTLAPGEFALYKEYYPLLNGETRKVAKDTNIQIYLSKENIQSKLEKARVKIYNNEIEFYKSDFKANDGEVIINDLSSNMFVGNATLLLELIYNDGKSESYNFYFEKEDAYSDIKLDDEPHINKSGANEFVISFEIGNFSKLLYPDKISVKSSSGKECALNGERKTQNIYNRIVVPFEPDALDRDYSVTIPAGVIMLEDGVNNEFVFDVQNKIEYVIPNNFLASTSPVAEHIRYISSESEDITVTITIKKEFRVDDTKPLFFNYEKVNYNSKTSDNGTVLTFNANVETAKKYNIEFGEGMIIGANGEKNGSKQNYNFSVVDINTINLPEKAIFTDVPTDHWAFDYISQLAIDDIITGYEDKSFKPNGFVTRGELAKMLAVSFKTTGNSAYSDVKNHWASQYIAEVGEFIPIKDKLFEADSNATRQDVAVALVNILDSEKTISLQEKKLDFDDSPMIDKEYISQIGKAVNAGIISGYEDGTFRPQEPITRAEVAAMIYRILKQ